MSFTQYKRLFLASLLAISMAGSAEAANKIDPILNLMKNSTESNSFSHSSLQKMGYLTMQNGKKEPSVEVFLKAETPQDVLEVTRLVQSLGGSPRSVFKNNMTAQIPLSSVDKIAASEKVHYIQAARKMERSMNAARGVTGVDQVQDGSGTNGTPYKGKDVIIGIVDTGIDCLHADFKGADGKSRILYYWDQTAPGNNGPIVNDQTGERGKGVEYSGADFESQNGQTAKCHNSPDTEGHGSHVSGIAAGKHSKYTGVAPEANIIVVKDTSLDTDIVDAMRIIFEKGKQFNKPVVINLSEGLWLGSHDNTSFIEVALNDLLMDDSGHERPGAAIVVSAGNSSIKGASNTQDGAFQGVHASINVPKGKTIAYEAIVALPDEAFKNFLFSNVWLTDKSIGCEIKINGFQYDLNNPQKDPTMRKNSQALAPDISMGTFAAIGNAFPTPIKSTNDNNIQSSIYYGIDDPSKPNSKLQAYLVLDSTRISNDGLNTPLPPNPSLYSLDIVFKASSTDCLGDMWLFSSLQSSFLSRYVNKTNAFNLYQYAGGDNDKTVTVPATASEVISVGSFMARQTWEDKDNISRPDSSKKERGYGSTKDDISSFSSLGPTVDGRIKPDITAPGEPIISVFSADANPNKIPYLADLDDNPLTPDVPVILTKLADSTHMEEQGTSMSAPFVTGMVALMLQKNSTLTHSQIKDLLKKNAKKDSFTGNVENNTWGAGKLNAVATMNAVPKGAAPGETPTNPSSGGSGCTLSPNLENFSLGILMVLLAVGGILSARFRKSE